MDKEQIDANKALEDVITNKEKNIKKITNNKIDVTDDGSKHDKDKVQKIKPNKNNNRSDESLQSNDNNKASNGKFIDIGIGMIRLPNKSEKIAVDRNLVGMLTYADLLGDSLNNSLNERTTEFGLIGVLGAAREGKTALSRAISRLHNIPYYSILEPYEGQSTVNQPSITLDDAVNDISSAFRNRDCDVIIIDSSRFINSVRTYGLAPGGTPTAYNVILTMLHNAAVLYGKLIILVISTMTNEPDHIALMRSMVIGSSLGLIEPSLISGGGRISIRGGDRDFIDFTIHEEEFMKLCDIKEHSANINRDSVELSVITNPVAVLENQKYMNEKDLQTINEFQDFITKNK